MDKVDRQVRYFRKRTYEDFSWESVFKGSIVKCEKCLNAIRASVLRENADMNIKVPKGKAPRLQYLDEISNWSIKIAVEAKKLANDPTWCCVHPPDETYFVKAIRLGVDNLLKNS